MALCEAEAGVEVDDFGAGVAAEDLAGVRGFHGDNFFLRAFLRAVEESGHVGEVILLVGIVGGEFGDVLVEGGDGEYIETGVDFAEFFLGGGGGLFFDDGADFRAARAFSEYPAIPIGIREIGAQEGHGGFLSGVERG